MPGYLHLHVTSAGQLVSVAMVVTVTVEFPKTVDRVLAVVVERETGGVVIDEFEEVGGEEDSVVGNAEDEGGLVVIVVVEPAVLVEVFVDCAKIVLGHAARAATTTASEYLILDIVLWFRSK